MLFLGQQCAVDAGERVDFSNKNRVRVRGY